MAAKAYVLPVVSAGTLAYLFDFARSTPEWAKPTLMPPNDWLWAMLVWHFNLPFFAVAVAAISLAVLVEWGVRKRAQRARPYFGAPDVRTYSIYVQGKLNETVIVASVPLHNNPRWRSEDAVIKRAHARLDFYDLKTGKFLRHTGGRWADNPAIGQPDAPSNSSELRFRDIQPNDSENLINIVARRPASEWMYALTEEGWLSNERGSRVLRSLELLVEVTVKSSNQGNFRAAFIVRCNPQSTAVSSISIARRHNKMRVAWRIAWRSLKAKA